MLLFKTTELLTDNPQTLKFLSTVVNMENTAVSLCFFHALWQWLSTHLICNCMERSYNLL